MADESSYKVVGSPVITDVDLPLPVHFNGLDAPQLDASAFQGNGPWVLKTGDTMSGSLVIKRGDKGVLATVPTQTYAIGGENTLLGGTTNLLVGVIVNSAATTLSNNDGSAILAELGVEAAFPADATIAVIDILVHHFGS